MLLSTKVEITISPNHASYWKEKGYEFTIPKGIGRGNSKTKMVVSVYDLPKNSNVIVECWCEGCGKFYTNRWSRYDQYCGKCRTTQSLIGNVYGSSNKGKRLPNMSGENHPRWNPNKDEFALYRSKVAAITRLQDINLLEHSDKPRGLCGVDGAYQLDHIISVKCGFDNNISPEIIGAIGNLQFLPWKENRNKWA